MKTLVQKMREQRMVWVELDATHKVRVLPPTEMQIMERVTEGQRIVDPSNLAEMVHEWAGFTEEDFLGKGIGSTDPLPLDRDALNELFAGDVDKVNTLTEAIYVEINRIAESRKEAAKN